jgi:hypothetical protein
MKVALHFLLPVFLFLAGSVYAQVDTTIIIPVQTDSGSTIKNPVLAKDTIKTNGKIDSVRRHDPRKATRRSALIPGWGQAYNKQHWKIPLVYGALGVTAGFYVYNHTWYRRTKEAFEIKIANDVPSFPKIDPKLKDISAESLRYYRNEFRRNRDYSVLYFLAAWGLNVADATVFGHLKDFDVSDDLSFKIKPGYSPYANTSGVSLVLAIKDHSSKTSLRSK